MPGRVVIESFDSQLLRGNPLGDPTLRRFPVYLPPGYDDHPDWHYPLLVMLSGYSGSGLSHENVAPWSETLSQRLDRLIGSGVCPPTVLVAPDCFTRLGGSQYINSAGTGPYEDYVTKELLGYVESRYRAGGAPEARAVIGKSSGGYGAMVLGMRHPDVFSALACHSGDMAFDLCYYLDFPKVIDGMAPTLDVAAFIAAFLAKPKKPSRDVTVMNIFCMAACYSPNRDSPAGFDLPVDLYTGRLREDVWARWLEQDPVRMVDKHEAALRKARLVYFDCGIRDNFYLHLGARQLSQELARVGVAHEHLEFDDDHFNVPYRYDTSVPKLLAVLRQAGPAR